MNVILLSIGIAILCAGLLLVFVSLSALRTWRDRPLFLIAAMFGWLAIAGLLIHSTRTAIPARLEEILEPSDSVAEYTDTTMTASDTSLGEVDSGSYASLVVIRDGRIDRQSYEQLGSARRTLLKIRVTEASARGDVLASQALRDIEAWEADRKR
jgi:hypothetical protein